MRLRSKLLLSALLLLLMPVTTVRFLRSMDKWLIERERSHLAEKVQSISSALSPYSYNWHSQYSPVQATLVFPEPFKSDIILDAFTNEWQTDPNQWVSLLGSGSKMLLGQQNGYLFVYIRTKIASLTPAKNYQYSLSFDNLELKRTYVIDVQDRGNVIATENGNIQPRIQGFWNKLGQFADMELRIPVDLHQGIFEVEIETDGKKQGVNSFTVLKTNPEQQKLMDNLLTNEDERIWLLGEHGELLAKKGQTTDDIIVSENPLLNWLIGTSPEPLKEPWIGISQFTSDWLDEARVKGVSTRVLAGSNRHQQRTIAVGRIGKKDQPSAYIIYEKITGTSLLYSQPYVSFLLNMSLGLMVFAIFIFLIFGGRLSYRIQHLQKQLAQSLDKNGRVLGIQKASKAGDELGQLSRNVHLLLGRQKNYQDYQERLASRLSHELRTPMAVVRGALENLQMNVNHDSVSLELIERGLVGIQRLSSLVSRMREAARLEEMINQSTCQLTDLSTLMEQVVEGMASIWPEYQISFLNHLSYQPKVAVAPELIAQALEKLVSNAVDFSTMEKSEIRVNLKYVEIMEGDKYLISVSNRGELLPENHHHLTENMVSVRKKASQGEAHLGLGLFIVGLIAQFHDGEVFIRNRTDLQGVIAGFTLSSCELISTRNLQ